MEIIFEDDELVNSLPDAALSGQHEPRTKTASLSAGRPIGIDLFSGVGGLSLGFEQSGFDIAAAVDIDPVHCASYAFNFPKTAVICASVAELSGQDIRARAGIGDQVVDCVFGGAPSQGFSVMGARSLDDPRNGLVMHFARLVHELDARSFVFENVSGITKGRHRDVLDALVTAFEAFGYSVRMDWKVLNAADFGVPQSRDHFILLGAKRGQKLPDYPSPICNPPGRPLSDANLPLGPSARDALGDLPDAERFEELLNGDVAYVYDWGRRSAYASRMRCETSYDWHLGYPRDWQPWLLTASARTDHTDLIRRRFAETFPGRVEPISRFFKLAPDGISNTLRAGTDGARGAFTSPRPIHYLFDRCITVREMARLHGFPDWFRPHSTKWHGARQIGLAVPPPLARAIAEEVVAALDVKPQAPQEVLMQVEHACLSFDMTEAARHFDVALLSGKRQRSRQKKANAPQEI